MKERVERIMSRLHALDPRVKYIVGILFILLGILALVTPFTPGSWLTFVGLEIIGIRILAWRRFAAWFRKDRSTEESEKSGL